MNPQIIGSSASLANWLQTPAGIYVADWETAQFDQAVADVFGYHGLQLGQTGLPSLRNSRIRHCWVGDTQAHAEPPPALFTDPVALPFADQSLDLVVLPHTLDLSHDPHASLREVERVLVPEGRVVISGFNPMSLWGQSQQRAQFYAKFGFQNHYLPTQVDFIGYWRLRDWLRLLSFEVEAGRFGCYRPSVQSPKWLKRFGWMDKAGARWWPIFGSVYFLVGVKRVRGMRLMGPVWKRAKSSAASAVPTVNKSPQEPQA
jgi:SAM-dependent methyltransferase